MNGFLLAKSCIACFIEIADKFGAVTWEQLEKKK